MNKKSTIQSLPKIALQAFTKALTSNASGQTKTRFKQALFAVLQSKFIYTLTSIINQLKNSKYNPYIQDYHSQQDTTI